MKNLIFLFTVLFIFNQVNAQPQKAITVFHCDPDDPSGNDNWPQSNISTIGWLSLNQMVQYAESKNVKVTIQMTMPWVNMLLQPVYQDRRDSVLAWISRGHEVGAHRHIFVHSFWDGFSNDPTQINGANGASLIDSSEVFYNQLAVLISPNPLLTCGAGPAGSSDFDIGREWRNGLIHRTTNKSGLNPDNDGGRFTDEAFSDVTGDTLYDTSRNLTFINCKLSYCFLESVDSVDTIIAKIDTSPYDVVGGVLHPFNYSASPLPYEEWIDSISVRFPGECKTVSTIIQESSCNSLLSSVMEYNNSNNSGLSIYPNPTSEMIYVNISSEQYQMVEASIYSLSGQKIKTFYSGYMPQGNFTIQSSLVNLKTGNYLIKVKIGASEQLKCL